MKLIIEIDLGNVAFTENSDELAFVLATVPKRIHGRNGDILWGSNRHVVGTAKIIERETHKGVPIREGKFWRWRHGPFIGVRLTSTEIQELGLDDEAV